MRCRFFGCQRCGDEVKALLVKTDQQFDNQRIISQGKSREMRSNPAFAGLFHGIKVPRCAFQLTGHLLDYQP